jgi:hypothetical protein
MNVENAPKASINNRAAVEVATVSCCYFCFTTLRPSQVRAFTDEGKTVLCPHCDVDAVLPGYHSLAQLEELHERWFTGSVPGAEIMREMTRDDIGWPMQVMRRSDIGHAYHECKLMPPFCNGYGHWTFADDEARS